jgi:hypothetical protein
MSRGPFETGFLKACLKPSIQHFDKQCELWMYDSSVKMIGLPSLTQKGAMRFYSKVVIKTHCYFFDIPTFV